MENMTLTFSCYMELHGTAWNYMELHENMGISYKEDFHVAHISNLSEF
jgi:hypothetical protein